MPETEPARRQRLQPMVAALGADAALITSLPNVRHLTGLASAGSMNRSMSSSRPATSRRAAPSYREAVASTAASPVAGSSSAALELARPVR